MQCYVCSRHMHNKSIIHRCCDETLCSPRCVRVRWKYISTIDPNMDNPYLWNINGNITSTNIVKSSIITTSSNDNSYNINVDLNNGPKYLKEHATQFMNKFYSCLCINKKNV